MKKLNIGDVFFVHHFPNLVSIDKIIRVTNAQAFSKNGRKFRIEYNGFNLSLISSYRSVTRTYKKETKELISEWNCGIKNDKFKKIVSNRNFSENEATQLLELIESFNKPLTDLN